VVWGQSSDTEPQYREWNGSSWLTAAELPDFGGVPRWVRLAADPVSAKVIAVALDDQSDVNASVWDGSSVWSAASQFETSVPELDRRNFDVVFEPAGTRALCMYTHTGTSTPYYRTYDGTNWSTQQTGPNITNVPRNVQLTPAKGGREIMIGVERNSDGALCFMRWDGSSMQDNQVLVSDTGGSGVHECFMMFESLEGMPATPSISSWAEVSP
jgi:hypothetical protein